MKKTTRTICIALTAIIAGTGCTFTALKGNPSNTSASANLTAPGDTRRLSSSDDAPKNVCGLSSSDNAGKNVCGLPLADDLSAYKRMFVYKNKLYVDTGETSSMPRCGVMDGQITKTVAADKTPKKNLQSNFGKYGFQFGRRKNRLEVCIDDTWHIFAYNENNLDGVTMSVDKNSARSARLTITNTTDREIIFGDDYELEKQNPKTKEWESVDYIIDNAAFNSIAYNAPKNKPTEWKVNWKVFHGTQKPGTYRIVKTLLDFKGTGNYTEYTLMSEFKITKK